MKISSYSNNNESNLPAELIADEIEGKSQSTNAHYYPRHIPTRLVTNLKYRGVTHTTGAVVDDLEANLGQCDETQGQAEARSEFSDRSSALKEATNIHLANIRQNLEHRLQVAKAKGDQNLITLLQAEAEQIA